MKALRDLLAESGERFAADVAVVVAWALRRRERAS